MKLCGVDAEDLAEMVEEIRELNPKPAHIFTADVAPPIVPDVMLRPLAGGTWQVELNNDTLPLPGWLDALVDEVRAHPAPQTATGRYDACT